MIQVPTWRIDGMTFPGKHTVDAKGREWTILRDGETGWQGSPSLRTDRTDRPYSHGAYRGASFRKERILSLRGRVWCPDENSREETERELASLCSDPAQLYDYRRTTDRFDQVAHVELDDEVLITNPAGVLMLEYSFQFAAPDPRIFDWAWQEPIATVPVSSIDGIDWLTDVDWGSDLDFGFTTTEGSKSKVGNYGTAPAHPLFRLKGPLSNPGIYHVESGTVIRYNSQIADGEYVVINCDVNPQGGWDGHTCYSTLRGNVRSLLTRLEWPVVNPQTVATFQLQATGATNSELMTRLRSAYW